MSSAETSAPELGRHLGLWGATGVGVGAIVGGGILALAGVAFATTGPAAIVAFAANGLIAALTALSFAEMAAAFPESGGTYTFSKKVLSVRAAFLVGWVVWFASIVAAVLYALGFAAFAAPSLVEILSAIGVEAPWLGSRAALTLLAVAATLFYVADLARHSGGGGQWATVGKVVVFVLLIAGGAWAVAGRSFGELQEPLDPFLPFGALGLLQAMGYTFIALQGFDLIAAIGGEVREPERNIPRSMLLSLGIALVIYVPLLLIIATVGVGPGGSITELAAANPETVVALAARTFLGPVGYWLVMIAAVLSMLSALQANLYAASRVALAMGRDRTLPPRFAEISARAGTPVMAILATAIPVVVLVIVLEGVATAGAVSSLIFLISFALAHWTAWLARRRRGEGPMPFRVPFFPLVPILGASTCLGLAIFQGVAVPTAGLVGGVWLAIGGLLYASIFARRARVFDASLEALDPELTRLRGHSPLVLVPIANPARAEALVQVASAIAPRDVGRVLMLSVVRPPENWQPGQQPRQLVDAQDVLGRTLATSFASRFTPEALVTISGDAWSEIARIAAAYRCGSLLLGFSKLDESFLEGRLEAFVGSVPSDAVILRSPPEWKLDGVCRVLVPVGGRRDQSELRARLLGRLARAGVEEIVFLEIQGPGLGDDFEPKSRRELERMAQDETGGRAKVEVVESGDVLEELVRQAASCDLVVMGLRRIGRRQKVFGDFVLRFLEATEGAVLMISQRG